MFFWPRNFTRLPISVGSGQYLAQQDKKNKYLCNMGVLFRVNLLLHHSFKFMVSCWLCCCKNTFPITFVNYFQEITKKKTEDNVECFIYLGQCQARKPHTHITTIMQYSKKKYIYIYKTFLRILGIKKNKTNNVMKTIIHVKMHSLFWFCL